MTSHVDNRRALLLTAGLRILELVKLRIEDIRSSEKQFFIMRARAKGIELPYYMIMLYYY